MNAYRCKHVIILCALCFSLFLVLPQTQAQQIYVQPMYQVAWTTKTIFISVPDNPAWAKTGFESAVQDWNQAQNWFLKTYEPNHPGAMYTLEIAQRGEAAQVTVQYVPNTGQNWQGQTSASGTEISIVISDFTGTEIVAEHELGHILGLGDNNVPRDLMSSNVPFTFPSTLNLYAAYAQAVSGNAYGNGEVVALPSQIPYTAYFIPYLPNPEFPSSTILIPILVALFILKRRLTS